MARLVERFSSAPVRRGTKGIRMGNAHGWRRALIVAVAYTLTYPLTLTLLHTLDSDLLPWLIWAAAMALLVAAGSWVERRLWPPTPIDHLPDADDHALGRVTLVGLGPAPARVARALRARGVTRELAEQVTDGSRALPVRIATALTDSEASEWRADLERARAVVTVEL